MISFQNNQGAASLQAASTACALLSAPSSGSRRHISPLEPQAGAKAKPNLHKHLSWFFSLLPVLFQACCGIFVSPTKAYTSTCSRARLSEPRSSQGLGRHGWKKGSSLCFMCNHLLCEGHSGVTGCSLFRHVFMRLRLSFYEVTCFRWEPKYKKVKRLRFKQELLLIQFQKPALWTLGGKNNI